MTKHKRISLDARLRARGLLDMMYLPSELADELGLNVSEIYRYWIPDGVPHIDDGGGQVWLHGPEVARWLAQYGLRRRMPLQLDEAHCLKCRQAVPMVNPTRLTCGKFTILKAICPLCGRPIHRGIKAA